MANKKDQPKGLKKALRSQLRDELKAEMETIEKKSTQTNIRIIGNNKIWMGIAAAVLLLVAAYFLIPSGNTVHPELAAEYFSPMKNYSVPIERGSTSLTPEQEAFLAYEANNFEEAAKKFENLPASTKDKNIGLFYAISLMGIGQDQSAIGVLRPFTNGEESGVQMACKWYLALAYLKIGETAESQVLLQELQSNSNPYQERAKEILGKI